MLDRGLIHQGHVREIRDVSTCTAQPVGAARRAIWHDVTLLWQRPEEHAVTSLCHKKPYHVTSITHA